MTSNQEVQMANMLSNQDKQAEMIKKLERRENEMQQKL